ncbi:MAG: hypothetical protein VXX36_11945 [Verrucomicrobiota bacterium]|nr:hypothetical protein [Verrucomicrobiota bacterium]
MHNDQQLKPYVDASAVVKRRIGMVDFANWVKRSHWLIGITGIVLVAVLRQFYGWTSFEVLPLLTLFGLWLSAGAVLTARRAPGVREALVTLDHSGAWKDRFASAWAFLNQDYKEVGEELHIERAGSSLEEALTAFPESTPLPDLKAAWVLPVLALMFSVAPILRPVPSATESILSEEMVEAASGQAEVIKREARQLDKLTSLTEDEQKELQQLLVDVDQMTSQLGEGEGLTTGEMLEALEARARAVERLARGIGDGEEVWASDAMIKAMANHPDTADMAVAVRDKNAESVAGEASSLQSLLESDSLSSEVEERMGRSLANISKSGDKSDEARPVGERFGNASTKMNTRQPLQAAREFEELAKHFRLIQERVEAREKLEGLAEAMREAGGEISGKKLEKMEELAASGQTERAIPEGLKGLESDELARSLSGMKPPQETAATKEDELPGLAGGEGAIKAPPVPGTSQDAPSGKGGGQQALKAPIPGEGDANGSGGSLAANGGEQGGGSSVQAPIPGTAPGDSEARSVSNALGGEAGDSSVSGQGGDQAGTGTAELVDTESAIHEAGSDSQVMAQINDDGESTFRAIDGEIRQEEVTRSRRDIAAEFIAVEEQALDGKSLPLSRRQHVVRYFSAIRQQFEREE